LRSGSGAVLPAPALSYKGGDLMFLELPQETIIRLAMAYVLLIIVVGIWGVVLWQMRARAQAVMFKRQLEDTERLYNNDR
jgi:hypothetical protein